jgi:membrane protein YdbS with pleckstrin-like domain
MSGGKTVTVSAREKLDWVLILAAVASLWPWAFGFRPPWYKLVLLASLAVMALMAARRIKLLRQLRR